ncbi:MAG: hypothetical protein ACXWD4_10310 [Bacteroidia bacterium]
MELNTNNKHNEWSPIRSLLKEKYSTTNCTGNTQHQNFSGNDYWNKFQQITGKSKEQIQTELRTF